MCTISDMFSSAVNSLLARKELQVTCSKTIDIRCLVKTLMEAIEGNKRECDTFSVKLVAALRSSLELKSPATMAKRRELLWSRYACMRAKTLPVLWEDFYKKISCDHIKTEPLVMELVNETILEQLITEMFPTYKETPPENEAVLLTRDEENVIRYACGYVAMKLQKKYLKEHGKKAAKFVSCLDCMYADGPSSSLLNYTREWVERVNRGGLFDVSDTAFNLLVAIETVMRNKLMNHLSLKKSRQMIKNLSNPDIQFSWNIMDTNLEEEESKELLTHIIKLWLNIRGFSISKEWMETYKHICSGAKKKKSLRRELKRQQQKTD